MKIGEIKKIETVEPAPMPNLPMPEPAPSQPAKPLPVEEPTHEPLVPAEP